MEIVFVTTGSPPLSVSAVALSAGRVIAMADPSAPPVSQPGLGWQAGQDVVR